MNICRGYYFRNKINKVIFFIIALLTLIGVFIGGYMNKRIKAVENDNFYQKLTSGINVNILVVGDSIGKGSGASESSKRWDSLLSKEIKEKYGVDCNITNISMGGNTSYAGYVCTMNLNDNIDYDLAIICYGQNDEEKDFSLYYESIIRALQYKYKNCEIISVLESSQREYTTKIQKIMQLDKYYRIPIADTILSFNNSGIDYKKLSGDRIHPSDQGHEIYAETIINTIDSKLKNNTSYVKKNLNAYNKDVVKFDTFKYIPVSEFKKVNDTTFKIQINNISGIMGIDYSFESGDNVANIYIDGQLFAAPTVSFNYDFSQRHIIIVNNNCKVDSDIRLEFGSTAQANGFKGITFSNIGN